MCVWLSFVFRPSHATQGPDADDFNPDRFIDDNGELLPPVADTRDGMLWHGFVLLYLLTYNRWSVRCFFSIHFPQIVFSLTCPLPGHLTYVNYFLQTLSAFQSNFYIGFWSQVLASSTSGCALSFDLTYPGDALVVILPTTSSLSTLLAFSGQLQFLQWLMSRLGIQSYLIWWVVVIQIG